MTDCWPSTTVGVAVLAAIGALPSTAERGAFGAVGVADVFFAAVLAALDFDVVLALFVVVDLVGFFAVVLMLASPR
ncbi:MAG: hypothetical protein WA790_16350 [Sulfitobacter sp.]